MQKVVLTPYFLISVLVICYILGAKGDSPFTYQFSHANIFHLAGNCLTLYYVYYNRVFSSLKTLLICYAISVVAFQTNSVGFSGVIFAMIGIIYGSCMTLKNTVTISISLLMGFVLPHISGLLHLNCFFMGFAASYIAIKVRRYNELQGYNKGR